MAGTALPCTPEFSAGKPQHPLVHNSRTCAGCARADSGKSSIRGGGISAASRAIKSSDSTQGGHSMYAVPLEMLLEYG
jgi:hypothetical protein